MSTIENFEKEILKKLTESKIVEEINLNSIFPDINKSVLSDLISKPYKIEISGGGIVFIDDNGDAIACPNFGSSIINDAKWLSDIIPSVNFDVEQGGNLRKAEEAESAFCCCIVCIVLQDEIFSSELNDVINNYDYDVMSPLPGYVGFGELLKQWQDLQSVVINVSISAAKYKISFLKKDTEKFLRDGIQEDLVIELRNLDTKIKDINRSYSTGVLSPLNVKKLTKIKILEYLESKNVEINEAIRKSNVEVLYRILHLSSEYISPITKKRLRNFAQREIDTLYNQNPEYIDIVGEKNMIIDRWKRRFIKLEKSSLRRKEVLKYLEDPNNYQLPTKL